MATVFRNATKAVAKSPEVQVGLKAAAEVLMAKAIANAHEHDDSGDYAASIGLEHGRVDWYVVASDPDAISKEFGRGEASPRGPSEGVYALTRALGES